MNKDQIIQCIHGFFQDEHVKKTITTIKKCEISGWESWLQVEFARYLQTEVYGKKNDNFSWYREYKIMTKSPRGDERGTKNNYIIPDFWISSDTNRLKLVENEFFLIEFKRSNKGNIHQLMEEDITKWREHIDIAKDKLERKKETIYYNSGVFFVGVDTSDTIAERDKDIFQGLESSIIEKPYFYRIDFLRAK